MVQLEVHLTDVHQRAEGVEKFIDKIDAQSILAYFK